MTKKILSPAPKDYTVTCGECGIKFTYELEDVMRNYNSIPSKYVTCPNDKCRSICAHYDQRL